MADRPYMCRDEGLFLPECDDCSQLEGRVKALEDCCETATEELADHEERISSAENTLTNHTQTLSEQNTRITANSNSISANTQSIGQAESEINSVKSRVTTAESDIDTLQEDLMSAQSDIQSNTDAIDSIERLPEVTSADDGKVLTVVGGRWGIEPSSLVGEAIVGQSTVGGGNNIFDTFYPVGSYYETSDANFDPNTAWGGTWELETQGQVHVSAGTNYEVNGALTNSSDGGEATHTLAVGEMPSHYHNTQAAFSIRAMSYNGGQPVWGGNGTTVSKLTGSTPDTITQSSNQFTPYNIQLNKNSDSKGGGEAHNNMQPYINVYRWHRTA